MRDMQVLNFFVQALVRQTITLVCLVTLLPSPIRVIQLRGPGDTKELVTTCALT